jgi:hypothetical protein
MIVESFIKYLKLECDKIIELINNLPPDTLTIVLIINPLYRKLQVN